MTISTDRIRRCILTLKTAWDGLQQFDASDLLYDIHRAACEKEFELVLDQSGRLLKKSCARTLPATGRWINSLSMIYFAMPPSTA